MGSQNNPRHGDKLDIKIEVISLGGDESITAETADENKLTTPIFEDSK